MKHIVILSTLFVIGSLFGWVLEVFFRRFVSQKKWMNPGFLTGPYLPIYGFGVAFLYGISNIPLGIPNEIVDVIVRILLIGVAMTLVEFIAGLIFIKGFGVKLWDYSNRKGNIMGIICPIFSLAWLAVGSLYYFLLNPILVEGISWLSDNLIYTCGKACILEDLLSLVRVLGNKAEHTVFHGICEACRENVDTALRKDLKDLVKSSFRVL